MSGTIDAADPAMRDTARTGGAGEPWLTRDFLNLVGRWDLSDRLMVEWGCGEGTAWWAKRCARVVAVEHDPAWASRVRQTLPNNASIIERPLGHDYYNAGISAMALLGDAPSLVIVDGRLRTRCIASVVPLLPDGALVVLDNADRPWYAPGKEVLRRCAMESGTTTNGRWETDWWRISAALVAPLVSECQALANAQPCRGVVR